MGAVSLSTFELLAYFIPSFRVAGKGLSVRVYRLKNMNTFATGWRRGLGLSKIPSNPQPT